MIDDVLEDLEVLKKGKKGASVVYQCFCEYKFSSDYKELLKHDEICSFYNDSRLKYDIF
jgi:hypothetical protein